MSRLYKQIQAKAPPGLKFLRRLRGQKETIGRFAWSPCGRFIASPSFDGTIRIWNVETGEVAHELTDPGKQRVVTVAWSPDGKRIVSAAGAQALRLWDASTGLLLRRLECFNQRSIVALDWSSNGRYFVSGSWDGALSIWDGGTGDVVRNIKLDRPIMTVAWSHSGAHLAVGAMAASKGDSLGIWIAADWEMASESHRVLGIGSRIFSVCWSADDKSVFCGTDGRVVVKVDLGTPGVWPVVSGLQRMEGHTGDVKAVTCSSDGEFLATRGGVNDNSIRIWSVESLQMLCVLREPSTHSWRPGIAFHPSKPILATLGERESAIRIWELDKDTLLSQQPKRNLRYTSAKVVLVGESNVGKSYLAHRVATGTAPKPTEIASTHGMKFWQLQPESATSASLGKTNVTKTSYSNELFSGSATEVNDRRDIILWDMGGQEEYRLIHQLFIHDTTVALVLMDPTRGTTAFKEVEAWNKSLQKQLLDRPATKLLVGAKVDQPTELINHQAIDSFRTQNGFAAYCETSAITGRGVEDLCKYIGAAIDWKSLGNASRPELFQQIRDEIESRRAKGEVILKFPELEAAVIEHDQSIREAVEDTVETLVKSHALSRDGNEFEVLEEIEARHWFGTQRKHIHIVGKVIAEIDTRVGSGTQRFALEHLYHWVVSADVATVAEQLAAQGLIARCKVATGEEVLVLQVDQIERYAGSLILAARKNPRGVPALELREIAQENVTLPGILNTERLPRQQEKSILDCTVQLMLAHGICFEHEGLLIFPSLFAPAPTESDFAHGISLYYDFAGAIDNIYASLIAWIVLAKEFGDVKLWADRAEFQVKDGSVCGLRKVARAGGFAHVDVYFGATTPDHRRKEFISFVEDHLKRNGVEIREHLAITCSCGYQFSEETLKQRIVRGEKDVPCPVCETRHSLTEGAAQVREKEPQVTRHTWALRTRIDKLREEVSKQVVRVLAKSNAKIEASDPIRLLHLSDLHFSGDTPVEARLQWLLDDIKQPSGLGFKRLDYLVISGDFTDKGRSDGFARAYDFVSGLTQEFGLSADRCIFVPGNHDVSDLREAYEWRERSDGLKKGEWVQKGDVVLARNADHYPLRLKTFSDSFYHRFLQRPYPLNYKDQGFAIPYWDTGIQFIALNSCWEIDQFYRKRASLHNEAVASALRHAEKQLEHARKTEQIFEGKSILRIAVWHHAITGPEQMKDTTFVENLQKNGVQLALHGDVHEMKRELIGYRTPGTMHVAASGSFGARAEDRPESTPRLYNVIEIARDLTGARIHTRCQPKTDGAWKGWNEWSRPDGQDGALPYYDIEFATPK